MVNRSREREAEEERERERDGEGGEEKAKTARIHLFPALFASHSATEGSKDTTGNSIRALPIANPLVNFLSFYFTANLHCTPCRAPLRYCSLTKVNGITDESVNSIFFFLPILVQACITVCTVSVERGMQ